MPSMNKFVRNPLAWLVLALGLILIAIFNKGIYSSELPMAQEESIEQSTNQEQKPVLVSSNPADFATIGPAQTIELTFNQPLENKGELKLNVEPVFEYDVELSDDRKTAKIIPKTPFPAGAAYTIFIKSDTKFDGQKKLEHEEIIHFKTVNHSGV